MTDISTEKQAFYIFVINTFIVPFCYLGDIVENKI